MPAAALVCCAVPAAGFAAGCSPTAAPAARDTATSTRAAVPSAAADLQGQYQKVIKEVLPSVVQIQASHELGSGVVYDDKGHIVTNAHVVGQEKTFKTYQRNGVEKTVDVTPGKQ